MNPTTLLDVTCPHPYAASPKEAAAVLHGLSAKQKYLPSWLFYDAAGSRLFEEITQLPEYYLTSREHRIFTEHAGDMIAAASGLQALPLSVVELGAGSASKTVVLLRELVARQQRAVYLPVDVSREALEWAGNNVRTALPTVEVRPICAEITQEELLHLPAEGRRLALYIGSSIGNFDPREAIELLRWLRSQLHAGDALLLGTDMVKDTGVLLAAYNDAAGVTAAFNKNVLARLNRELEADFDLDSFAHLAVWNAGESRMEMHLDSQKDQTVRVPALERTFAFHRGESIHTENSYKFTSASVEDILLSSGFLLERSWYDEDRWFGVHLARVVDVGAMGEDVETMEAPEEEEEAAA